MCHDVYDLQTHDCRHPYCWPHVVCKYKSITNVSVEIFADGKIEFAGSDKQKKEMQQKLNNDQLNFDKSLVYVGGEKLENALRNGKWKNTSITSNHEHKNCRQIRGPLDDEDRITLNQSLLRECNAKDENHNKNYAQPSCFHLFYSYVGDRV